MGLTHRLHPPIKSQHEGGAKSVTGTKTAEPRVHVSLRRNNVSYIWIVFAFIKRHWWF